MLSEERAATQPDRVGAARPGVRDVLAAQAALVDMITRGEALSDVLAAIAASVESISSGTRCVFEVELLPTAGPTCLVSSAGVLDQGKVEEQPGPGAFVSAITAPEGQHLGRLVLEHPASVDFPPERDDVVGWATRLAAMAVVRGVEHERMSASVALLGATLESTVDGILVVDDSGRIVGHNEKFAHMWRIDRQLLSSNDDARVMASVLEQLADPDGFVDQVRRLYSNPDQTSFDELAFLDGRVFERYSQPQRVDGATVGRVWSFRDVTDKRTLARELQRQTRTLELLGSVAAASNSASTVRDALRATLESFAHYWGASVAHAYLATTSEPRTLNHSVWWLAPGEDFADFRAVTEATSSDELQLPQRILTTHEPERVTLLDCEPRSARADAALAAGLVSACAFPILVREETVGVLEFFTTRAVECDPGLLQVMDQVGAQLGRVVERDRAENGLAKHTTQLERLTRRLESVLNSAGEGICGLDGSGSITFVNRTGADLLGVPVDLLIGRDVDEVVRIEEDPSPNGHPRRSSPDATRVASAHRVVTGRHRRPDGSTFECELVAAPIVEEGTVVGSVLVFRDISERRAVDRMKDEFIAVVSHELRTPLTSIRGSLGLLAGGAAGALPPKAARMVDVATTSADRLVRLINDILDVERLLAGRLTLDSSTIEAGSLVSSAVLETVGLAEDRQVKVSTGDTPGWVRADADRVVQVLTNLLGNAIKFSPPGSTVVVDTADLGDSIRFDVRDEGPGIPADQLEAVFERFRQADASDTRQQGGTGLGLAISRALVEQLGGRIWAESEVGRGTTLSFTLPRGGPEPDTAAGTGGGGRS